MPKAVEPARCSTPPFAHTAALPMLYCACLAVLLPLRSYEKGRFIFAGTPVPKCSGILIAPKVVLTAGALRRHA